MADQDTVLGVNLSQAKALRYGTNPHQTRAWILFEDGPFAPDRWKLAYEGKPLSFTNWEEILCAVEVLSLFSSALLTAVVYKHESPCGIACHVNPVQAFRNAWSVDAIASFGSTVAINTLVDEALAEAMIENFLENLVCLNIKPEALEILKKKWKNLRVLVVPAVRGFSEPRWELKKKLGVTLIQEGDTYRPSVDDFIQVSRQAATEEQLYELTFAAVCCRALFSNATVITADRTMLGYGRHGSSRVDTCQWAVDKARQYDRSLERSVAVTDGFFPFPDGLEVLAKAGVKVIACPNAPTAGQKSKEVIAAADKLGVAFYHLNHRLFRH